MISAAGKHLAQLHVSRPHRFEVVSQLIRRGRATTGRFRLLRTDGFVNAHLLHEIGAAVLPQQQTDFFVAFEMVGGDFHFYSMTGCERIKLGTRVRRPHTFLTRDD